jgi:predicted glycosyltransferase
MKIAYHAINGTGLGHLMRLSAVAMAVRAQAPETQQLLLTQGTYGEWLRRLPLPILGLPLTDQGPWASLDRRVRTLTQETATRLLRRALLELAPDWTVFDTHAPKGLPGKLREKGLRTALVLRLGTPEALARALERAGEFDRLFFPHDPAELPEAARSAGVAVGPIVFPGDVSAEAQQAARARFGLASDYVLVTPGSGGYGPLAEAFVDRAVARALDFARPRGLQVAAVLGPYASVRSLAPDAVRITDAPDMQALLAGAALVVGHAGYNTTQEVRRTGVRALLVPLPRKTEDQARHLAPLLLRKRLATVALDAPDADWDRAIQRAMSLPAPQPEQLRGAEGLASSLLDRRPVRTAAPGLDANTRILLVDAGRLDALPRRLGGAVHVELDLGEGTTEALLADARGALAVFAQRKLSLEKVVVTFRDPSGGAQLPLLVAALPDLGGCVARVPSGGPAQARWDALEQVRALGRATPADLTPDDSPVGTTERW